MLIDVRAVLTPLAPTHLRDAIPLDASGNPVLPDTSIIVDLVSDVSSFDFTSVFSSVLLQIGCWSPSIAAAFHLQEQVRTILAERGWDIVRVNPTQTDGQHRGVLADYSNLR